MTHRTVSLSLILGLALLGPALGSGSLPDRDPAALQFDPVRLEAVGEAVKEAVARGEVAGAVVLVGRWGGIALAQAHGDRSVVPAREPMTRDTVFDLASLTKPVATATAAMILWQEGKLGIGQKAAAWMKAPGFHPEITLEHLLRHRSGLIADNPLQDYAEGAETAWERLEKLSPLDPPGARFRYSDVGFLVLGRVVEQVAGQPLDVFARERIFEPLGMMDTCFRPLDAGIAAERIAPTEPADGVMLRGVVHDPRARALGGVAGHAGLFGTADDLAVYVNFLLEASTVPRIPAVLSGPTILAMVSPGDTPEGERRGLGWDMATSYSAPRGAWFGPRSFGHTGFTGTSLWADPDTGVFVILLTSRLHPDGQRPAPTALRRRVATLAAAAVLDGPASVPRSEPGSVRCGIDVLEAEGFERLKGKRVGLVTNQTGRTRDGRSTIDALFRAEGVELKALFSPEHGIRGLLDTKVDDSRDEATGLPVYSLYGETRKPKPESLENLDLLVYDIQDIGCRFYTYISTLVLVMEAAKEKGIPLLVLDRPNPIGGVLVEGPVRDDGLESFIAIHDLPVRHGMTVGELARMFNAERGIGAEIDVVPCQGWRRSELYDETGLLWINPSPNMRSLTQALLYPGVGLLEATNLATGRGTDTPFERVGAPWIDPVAWAAALNGLGLPGVRFTPVRFTPKERQYAGEECGGVYIAVTDRKAFRPLPLAFGLASTLRKLYPDHWVPDGLQRMLCDRAAYQAVVDGKEGGEIEGLYREELAAFRSRRTPYLIYP